MKWIFRMATAAYLAALGLYLGGTLGWFGQRSEAIADRLLAPIGLPWNTFLADSETYGVVVLVLAPLVNLGILWLIADLVESRED